MYDGFVCTGAMLSLFQLWPTVPLLKIGVFWEKFCAPSRVVLPGRSLSIVVKVLLPGAGVVHSEQCAKPLCIVLYHNVRHQKHSFGYRSSDFNKDKTPRHPPPSPSPLPSPLSLLAVAVAIATAAAAVCVVVAATAAVSAAVVVAAVVVVADCCLCLPLSSPPLL